MHAYEIDENGYIVANYNVNGDVNIPEGCITVQLPQPLPFRKPKWNSHEWIEGATQEEIDEMTKVEPSPPTQDERIAELEQIINMILMGEM